VVVRGQGAVPLCGQMTNQSVLHCILERRRQTGAGLRPVRTAPDSAARMDRSKA
jgi:hypothetical protein